MFVSFSLTQTLLPLSNIWIQPSEQSLRTHVNGLWLWSVLWSGKGLERGLGLGTDEVLELYPHPSQWGLYKEVIFLSFGEMGCPYTQIAKAVKLSWVSVMFPCYRVIKLVYLEWKHWLFSTWVWGTSNVPSSHPLSRDFIGYLEQNKICLSLANFYEDL